MVKELKVCIISLCCCIMCARGNDGVPFLALAHPTIVNKFIRCLLQTCMLGSKSSCLAQRRPTPFSLYYPQSERAHIHTETHEHCVQSEPQACVVASSSVQGTRSFLFTENKHRSGFGGKSQRTAVRRDLFINALLVWIRCYYYSLRGPRRGSLSYFWKEWVSSRL